MIKRIFWVTAFALVFASITLPAAGEVEKAYRVEPTSEALSPEFFTDFYTLFASDALVLNDAEHRAVYDVLLSAARRIENGDYKGAADMLAVIPDETESVLRPVVTMREDLSLSDPIKPFAEHEARGELMKYHREVWTSHPEFAEDFSAFAEDFAKRASRREKTHGAPYIIDHLSDYGFTPRAGGGGQQSYLFLWTKFNAISKFASTCDKFGLDYEVVSIDEYCARVSWGLAERLYAAREEARGREQGRLSWSELIDEYSPEPEPVLETPEAGEIWIPETEPEVEEELQDDSSIEEPYPDTDVPSYTIEDEEPVAESDEGPSEFEILINPLSLFTPPEDVETPEDYEPAFTPPEEEETEPLITPEDVAEAAESETTSDITTFEPEDIPLEMEPVVTGELPAEINAVPIPPGEVSGTLSVGIKAETGPVESTHPAASMEEAEIILRLAAISEDAIDNAAEKALELGREALDLAKRLIEDPKHEKEKTKDQLGKFRSARSDFLAASALIDRYRLEQYLEIPVDMIEEEIIAELRRPYDDLKASPAWEDFRDSETDFDDAFMRISSDFRDRRTNESIYAGEIAALEAHIVDYEHYMLEIEELLAALEMLESSGE